MSIVQAAKNCPSSGHAGADRHPPRHRPGRAHGPYGGAPARAARASPRGAAGAEVAAALGRSASTTYSLLDTLCQEGLVAHLGDGTYRLGALGHGLVPSGHPPPLPDGLGAVLDELFARSHKRAYLAVVRDGRMVIPATRGRQGMPLVPGLGAGIGDNAHALALGKVGLSLVGRAALVRYLRAGLRAFTPATIVAPDRLCAELAAIRDGAVATEREEFRGDVCGLALPVRDADGRAVAALGLSMSARCFAREREPLAHVLRGVAARATAAAPGA